MTQGDRAAAVAVVGAGIAGVATAYSLAVDHGIADIVLVDAGQPMAFTSARSGDNYRNWWPHPAMAALTNRSIDLMEGIARRTGNRIGMTRRGYALATREPGIDRFVEELQFGFGDASGRFLRVHSRPSARTYRPPLSGDWEEAPDGVDILCGEDLIREVFPSFDPDVRTVIHIRRAGDIDGYQLGAYMLEAFRDAGGKRLTGTVAGIEHPGRYALDIRSDAGTTRMEAEQIVNAAGPFAAAVAGMLGVELPVHNTLQQKLAFEDTARAIPRHLPFSIDLDRQRIDWTDDEREVLHEDPELARFAGEMPGAIHCRPDGGDRGTRVKLGWAFNERTAAPTWNPSLDAHFPDIVLRGASRLHPALARYAGNVPGRRHHYGGWYTMTEENWPLIGPMGPEDAFMNCAHSGFGTMVACAAGELCAAWVAGAPLPDYATGFSLRRCEDVELMALLSKSSRGVL